MRRRTRIVALGALLACTPLVSAQAQSVGDTVAEGVICDEAQQVKYYARLRSETALKDTNAHFGGPSVCGEGKMMFSFDPEKYVEKIRTGTGKPVRIVEIMVSAILTVDGWRPIKPWKQFTVLVFDEDEERGV